MEKGTSRTREERRLIKMNDLLFGAIYITLILMVIIFVYFALFIPKNNINLKAFYRRVNVVRKKKSEKKAVK